jgi:hypothetical protein
MPTTHCDNCDRKIRVIPKRLKAKPFHLCMFCSNNLPEKYRCKGFRKGTAIRCRQKAISDGYCNFHQDQKDDNE